MKRLLFLIAAVLFLVACEQQRSRPDSPEATAVQFVEGALKGDYKWSRELMLADSINNYELDLLEKKYNTEMSAGEKENYRKSKVRIYTVEAVKEDSIYVITYANTYKNKKMPIKVVKKDDKWQVDLNYTFTGNL